MLYLLFFVSCISCRSYTTIVTDKDVGEREDSLIDILLEKDQKSITFIDKLSNSEITVFADDEMIFKDFLEFNEALGASKGIKISSTTKKVLIRWDANSLILKIKKDYPFIYIYGGKKIIIEYANVPMVFN